MLSHTKHQSLDMSIPAVFTGYGVKDEVAGKKYALEKIQYTPKTFNELDVDIKIDFCKSSAH